MHISFLTKMEIEHYKTHCANCLTRANCWISHKFLCPQLSMWPLTARWYSWSTNPSFSNVSYPMVIFYCTCIFILNSYNTSSAGCKVPGSPNIGNATIRVTIDGKVVQPTNLSFSYVSDPTVESVEPLNSFVRYDEHMMFLDHWLEFLILICCLLCLIPCSFMLSMKIIVYKNFLSLWN